MKEKKKKKGTPLPDDLFIVHPENAYLLERRKPYSAVLTAIISFVGLMLVIAFGVESYEKPTLFLISMFTVLVIICLVLWVFMRDIEQRDMQENGTRIIGQIVEYEGQVQFETRRRRVPYVGYEDYQMEHFYLRMMVEFTPNNELTLRTEVTTQRNDMQFKALPHKRSVAIYYLNKQDFRVI